MPYVTTALADAAGPFVAVSDWMRAVPDQIARWVPGQYTSLGTDGFGFSDTRPAARRFFHVDAQSITLAVLSELARSGAVPAPARPGDHEVQAGPAGQRGAGVGGGGCRCDIDRALGRSMSRSTAGWLGLTGTVGWVGGGS